MYRLPTMLRSCFWLAARHMRGEKPGHTLQTTALVNEAYCRLVELKEIRWQNRAQFFAIASLDDAQDSH